jgi:hypothetical protein
MTYKHEARNWKYQRAFWLLGRNCSELIIFGSRQMTAIARVFSRAFPTTHTGLETLKALMIFCGAGLIVSLLLATNGLDLSLGVF